MGFSRSALKYQLAPVPNADTNIPMLHHLRWLHGSFPTESPLTTPVWPRLLVVLAVLVLAGGFSLATAAEGPSLAERLGYKATDRVLIINGDDVSMCHAANLGTIQCLEQGLMRSATIMVPCPWFPEIAAYAKAHPDKEFGIHLCHTSEWHTYRWGPVAPRDQVPGLVDPDGYLWHEVEQVYAHATPTQALVEARAQIRRALDAGIDVTHLDSHMGTLQYDPEYMKVYLQLAVEFDLPLRMGSQETLTRFGHPEVRPQFAAKGILFPDHFIYDELPNESKDVKAFWLGIVKNLKPGVTELYIHAALPTDELKAITGSWKTRSAECALFSQDPDMKKALADQGIILIGYRAIRDLQRRQHHPPTKS